MKVFDKRLYTNMINTVLTIAVNAIDICNYSCEYCYNKRPRSGIQLNLQKLTKFIENLYSIYSKEIEILILGGEPMLHKQLYNFCTNDNPKIKYRIFSNFSKDIDYYLKFLNIPNVSFNFTWHHSNYQTANDFIKKIYQIPFKYFLNEKIEIVIMYEHYYIEDSLLVFDSLVDKYGKYINFTFVQDAGNNKNYNFKYTTQQLSMYAKRGYSGEYFNKRLQLDSLTFYDDKTCKNIISTEFDDPTKHLNAFQNWVCNAGIDQLYIHYNGDVSPCEDLYIQKGKILGNIYQSNYSVFNFKKQLCPFKTCPCPFFSMKTKIFN